MPRRAFVSALIALSVAGLSRAADAEPAKPPEPKKLETVIEEITALLKESKTPGMSLAIVTKDDVLFAGGLGLADVARQLPATADTRFRIGSTSKAFTALAALKLQAEGRLDLNATLASLAPEIEFQNPWEATDPVRIVHLLEHTTGFDDIHLRDYANQDPRPDNLREALAHDPDSRRCRWRPGTRHAYCNAGPPIVAFVIQKITGEVFEDYVQREFFTPIGMKTATYFRPADDTNLAQLYDRDGVTPFDYWHISMRPAGAINASANDMASYVRFYLNRGRVGDRAIVSEADILRMEQPAASTAARAGLTQGYGLCNYTIPDEDGRVWHGHGGGVQGGVCDMSYLPEAGVGYALMLNSGDGGTMGKTARLLRRFLTQGLAKPETPATVPVADEVAARCAGFYLPVSPRVQLSAIAERVAAVSRLKFVDGEAAFGRVFSGSRRYVGVTSTLLRRKDQAAASMVLLEPSEKDDASLVVYRTSFRRVPAIVAFAPHALLVVAGVMILSTLVFLPVWVVRGLRKKIPLRAHLGLRLWPLGASLALLWFVGAAVVMAGDSQIFQNYGSITARSLGLATSSVLALLSAWVGLVAVWRARRRAPHRGLWWHAAFVLLTLSALTLYLVYAGTIPLVTWS
jgi:CubicO group peptidase (beta-lactamase class C family)